MGKDVIRLKWDPSHNRFIEVDGSEEAMDVSGKDDGGDSDYSLSSLANDLFGMALTPGFTAFRQWLSVLKLFQEDEEE